MPVQKHSVESRRCRSITTQRQLLKWLKGQLLASEPKRPINGGLVKAALQVIEEVHVCGRFKPYEWDEILHSLFASIAESEKSPLYPVSLVGFVTTAYAEMIDEGEVTIEDVNRILTQTLLMSGHFLRIKKVGERLYLRSTSSFVQRYGTEIRVRLRQKPDGWTLLGSRWRI